MKKQGEEAVLKYTTRHWTVGLMVGVSVLIAGVLMVLLQRWAFAAPVKWDMTSRRVNSLGPGTTAVLKHLGEHKIRLTNLYYKSDYISKEQQDVQERYRTAVNDLLRLYQVENPRNIETGWINPLTDQAKLTQTLERLRNLPVFVEERKPYEAAVEAFLKEDMYPAFKTAMQEVLQELRAADPDSELTGGSTTGQLQRAVRSWIQNADAVAEDVSGLLKNTATSGHTKGVNGIKSLYSALGESIGVVANAYIDQQLKSEVVSEDVKKVLGSLKGQLTPWVDRFTAEQGKLQNLPSLEWDNIESALRGNNQILVESEHRAKVLPFEEVWPPADEGKPVGEMDFKDRRFAGQGAITPAIMQVIDEQKTGVLFVRYGGASLFAPAGMGAKNQQLTMTGLKDELEKLNFQVAEWDLSKSQAPPPFQPTPKRTIYIVLRPWPKMGPQGPQPGEGIGPGERLALLSKMGEDARAIFLTGFSVMSPKYEFNEYLKTKWGIEVDGSALTISAQPSGPGEWQLDQRGGFVLVTNMTFGEDEVTKGLKSLEQQMVFPMVTPMSVDKDLPEGVSVKTIAAVPKSEDVWAVHDPLGYYQAYAQTRNSQGQPYTSKTPNDISGPFPTVVEGTKGKARVVVFGADAQIFSDVWVGPVVTLNLSTGQLEARRRAPGNYALLTNLLYSLDDRSEWLNVGSPLDASVLAMNDSQRTAWQVIVVGLWPLLALIGGGLAWYMRRR